MKKKYFCIKDEKDVKMDFLGDMNYGGGKVQQLILKVDTSDLHQKEIT
jgi:hypothetical protein